MIRPYAAWPRPSPLLLTLVALLLTACSAGNGARATPDPLVNKGAALYQANCQSCHGGAAGGSLRDIPPPHNASGHTWHHPDQQLTEIILNGLDISLPGESKMPAFKDKLNAEDVQAILALLKTWWTPEQRKFQAEATTQQQDWLDQQRNRDLKEP